MDYRPMLAKQSTATSGRRPIALDNLPPKEWVFDQKLDGIRAILYAENNQVRLVNRNGATITGQFPEIARVRTDTTLVGET